MTVENVQPILAYTLTFKVCSMFVFLLENNTCFKLTWYIHENVNVLPEKRFSLAEVEKSMYRFRQNSLLAI